MSWVSSNCICPRWVVLVRGDLRHTGRVLVAAASSGPGALGEALPLLYTAISPSRFLARAHLFFFW